MDTVIGMHEAKSTLSELVQRAAAGETILIGPRGQALVKLISLQPKRAGQEAKPRRRIGILKGKLKVPDDFNDPLPDDLLDLFDGGFAGGFPGKLAPGLAEKPKSAAVVGKKKIQGKPKASRA
jgi:antitoxin (DNA-binding transcriptional repressor) of toxin-antitoxin stability system